MDSNRRVAIGGHAVLLPRDAVDLGRLDGRARMSQMVMVLQASREQNHALRQVIDEQLDRSHPNFQRWMTPEEYATRFGVADEDLVQVAGWLRQSGFVVDEIGAGKRFIRFSGSVSQVESAFRTEMHWYSVGDRLHIASAGDISVPEALKPVIAGVPTLHDFFNRADEGGDRAAADVTQDVRRHYTSGSTHFVGAGDFAAIYNTTPLLNATSPVYDGAGVSIGILGRSGILLSDVQIYREFFGLKTNDPTFTVVGQDSGLVPGDQQQSSLEVEISGGVAPGASVNFITARSTLTSDGADLAALYAVEHNLVDIISLGYAGCEAIYTSAQASFYNSLWAQAAAQGQSVFVSTGNSGPAACDAFSATFSSNGYAVSMQASTPYNVAVGGTYFAEGSGTFWGTTVTNSPPFSSALGYIPEISWNESRGSGVTGAANLWAGGGGISAYFMKPSWQQASGVPLTDPAYPNSFKSDPLTAFVTGPHRYLPDLALGAGINHDGALFCSEGICQLSSANAIVNGGAVGGAAVSTASMAGVQALVNQYNGGRQGLPNYVYYALAKAQQTAGYNCSAEAGVSTNANCAFHDVVTGNTLICGDSGCTGSKLGWTAAAGYDLATGLGSPNAYNLARLWSTVSFNSSTTTLALSQTTAIVHGQSVTASGTVSAGSGGGIPTGNVAFIASSGDLSDPISASTLGFRNPMAIAVLDGSGHYSVGLTNLPAGTFTVTARYGGDGTYASSLSAGVQVVVSAENSTVTIQPNAYNTTTCVETPSTTFLYGALIWTDVTVIGTSAQGVPAGTVAITDNSGALITTTLNPNGVAHMLSGAVPTIACLSRRIVQNTAALTVGTHVLNASYAGNGSFHAGTASPVTITITPATVSGALATASTNISTGGSVQLTFTLTGLLSAGLGTVAPTGTVTFTDTTTSTVLGTGSLSATTTLGARAVLSTTAIVSPGAHFVQASWPGDTNYGGATSSNVAVTVQSGTATSVVATSNSNPAVVGGRPTWTATMTPTTVTSGTVSFFDNGILLGTGTVGAAHTATFRPAATVSLPAGVHLITAIYAGNGTFNSSASPALSQTFNPTVTTIQLTVKNNGAYGESFALSAALGLSGTVMPPAMGTITFLDGSTTLGTMPFTTVAATSGGFGIFQSQMIAVHFSVGTHTITATLTDANYTAVVSNTQTITVGQATPTITISNIPVNASYGGNFTPAFAYTGDGTTSVTSGSTSICTVAGGIVSFIGAGTCSLTAQGLAGINYAGASGAPQTFVIHALTPGPPQSVTAVAGNGSATVSFGPPASDGGAAITLYTASCSPGPVTSTGLSGPILVAGLTNGTAYTCMVAATNTIGPGLGASATAVTPAGPPDAPQSVSIIAGNASATVAFAPPANNRGSAIVSYTVICSPGPVTITGAVSPIIVTGLINGTVYACTVAANNGVGRALATNAPGNITPAGPPDAPLNVGVTAGNGLLSISFNPPTSNGGAAIATYTAICNPGLVTVSGPASPLLIPGLTNGTSYLCTVAATNTVGIGLTALASAATPAGPPDAPQNLAVTAGNGLATASFDAPANNRGSAIVGYTVICNPGAATLTGPGSPITIVGLTNGTAYLCSVAANNSVGMGTAANALGSVTPAGPPDAPQNVIATTGNGSLMITFSPPGSNRGAAITSYTATCNPGVITATGRSSPITVPGLVNGTPYQCGVAAINAIGTGAAAFAGGAATPAGPPSAPQNITVTAGSGVAMVGFDPPANNGGAEILTYTAICNPGQVTVTETGSPITIPGLSSGATYFCTVSATNSFGTGPAAGGSTGATPGNVPGPPVNATLVAGNGSVTISFSAPVSNGGTAITSYVASCSPGSANVTGASSPITVMGLTNGTAYSCSIAAVNVAGTGPSLTIPDPVIPAPFNLVNGASFKAGGLTPGYLGTLSGQNLAPATISAGPGALPTVLANTTLTLVDSTLRELPMQLYSVSPTQINFVVPGTVSLGPATVVLDVGGVTTRASATVKPVEPGLFTASSTGIGPAAANVLHLNRDGTFTYGDAAICGAGGCTLSPIVFTTPDQRIYLVFYGTGFRQRSSLSGVTVSTGGFQLPVQYAGTQPSYPGVDQLNVELPRLLAGAATLTVVLTVDGQQSNPVMILVQ